MTTAFITPLRGGTAALDYRGFVTHHPSEADARACARRNDAEVNVLPRRSPERRPQVEVLADITRPV